MITIIPDGAAAVSDKYKVQDWNSCSQILSSPQEGMNKKMKIDQKDVEKSHIVQLQ